MSGHVKIAGTFKEVAGASAKVSGTWKTVTKGYTKVGGVWKQWLASVFPWYTSSIGVLRYQSAAYIDLANGKYFAFGGLSPTGITTTYYYSVDGLTWTQGSLPAVGGRQSCAVNDTTIVVSSPTGVGYGYTSTNGTTWTLRTITPEASAFWDGIWDGSRFIFVGNSTNSYGLAYSTDGISWSTFDIGEGGQAIGYDGSSTYIVLAAATTSAARRCTSNPTVFDNWSDITLPSSGRWTSVVHNGSIWVATAQVSSAYATSLDGITWTARTLPSLFSQQAIARMIALEGEFFYYFEGNLYSSSDGVNWTSIALPTATLNQVVGWAISPDKIIGLGYRSTVEGSTDYIVRNIA